MSKDLIVTALQVLDVENDAMWTQAGLPSVDVVKAAAGLETLTREEITNAAPNFTRTNPSLEADPSVVADPAKLNPEPEQIEPKEPTDITDVIGDNIVATEGEVETTEQAALQINLEKCDTTFVVNLSKEDLEPFMEAAKSDLDFVRAELTQLEQIRDKLVTLEHCCQAEIDKRLPKKDSDNPIAAYFASQDEQRKKEAEELEKLRAMGIDAKPHASRLDFIMGQRRSKHATRQVRRLIK